MLRAVLILALAAEPLAAQKLQWLREQHTERLPPSVFDILSRAKVVTIYALNPMTVDSPPNVLRPGEPSPEVFDNFYPIIGKVRITNPRQVTEVATALRKDIQGLSSSACFNPRHGVRAEVSGRRVDFVICFECHTTVVVVSEDVRGRVFTDEGSLVVLNKLLMANGVTPLAPPSGTVQ